MNAQLQWSPLLPHAALAALAVLTLVLIALAWRKKSPDFYWRALFFALAALALLNPVIVREVREGLPDKLVIVVDESASQKIGKRDEAAEKALAHIQETLSKMPNVEPLIIRAGKDAASVRNQNTSLFTALQENLDTIPRGQVAGTVLITDGQVHDAPQNSAAWQKLAPFHVILTGRKDEFDRRVVVTEAPKYGLLSQEITIKVRVEDTGRAAAAPAALRVTQDGKTVSENNSPAGEEQSFTFKLDHPGQNVFEFSVPAEKGELTASNNSAAVIVNGVRDRLKALLVSGKPHIGERAWRDLLKSDPSIDLVHFTILRSPASFDATPPREMALIAFPVEELFEKKIKDFDLIIFDKYAQYGLLQQHYFTNIANFVKNGGAFLMAMGSDVPEQSLFETELGAVLPFTAKPPESSILSNAYTPALTDIGKNHPVTGDLPLRSAEHPWGQWLTQTDVNQTRGQTLMTGAQGRPLLILDTVNEGRVAALTSDNIWMWAKGLDGGGPYTELLRHVAHWLMKEPELEEDFIKADVRAGSIRISQRNLATQPKTVTLTKPDGSEESLTLVPQDKNWMSATVDATQNGIYRFNNGKKSAFAVVGTAASAEFSDVRTTPDKVKPLVDKTGGSVIWFSDESRFSLKKTSASARRFGGGDWIGLKENGAYAVKNIHSAALIPNGLLLFILAGGLFFVWRRESGK